VQLPILADFIQQLYAGAINPETSYFLPVLVMAQTTPLEPLAVGDYDWGDLAQVSKTLPAALCKAISTGGTPSGTPHATMSLTAIRVVGLSNITPAQPTVSGTAVSVKMSFGAAAANLPPGITVPSKLLIRGMFTITLTGCAQQPQQITGLFTVTCEQATLDVALDVPATAGKFAVTVTGLTFAAGTMTFAFQANGAQSGPVNTALREAFNEGAKAPLQRIIQQRLAAPGLLANLGTSLTTAFNSLADPSLLAFAISMLYKQSVKPTGSYYMPTAIKKATNPVLEPFAAGGWLVPDVGQWYPDAGTTICSSIGATINVDEIQTPDTLVPLNLDGIAIAGTSNLSARPPLTIGNSIYGIVACNSVPGWPLTLNFSGTFGLKVTCCQTENGKTCSKAPEGSTGAGTFKASIAAATVSVLVAISVSKDGKLVATADSIYFRCDPNADNTKNVQIDIKITSIPGGQQKVWNDIAMEVFNSPQATAAMVGQIQAKMNGQAVRDRLSQVATDAIQSVLPGDHYLIRRMLHEVRNNMTGQPK